jgi:penicillin amidase
MNRTSSAIEFCESTRPWLCPTWNLLCADVDGHIGLQTTGRIPIRNIWNRGYRHGWDPRQQWAGLMAFEQMPRLIDPERGYIVTANNRLAPDDYPIPLACTSTSGHRARRIRQEIERHGKLSIDENQRLQNDVFSLRAAECVPLLLNHLRECPNGRVQQAIDYLRAWDYRVLASSVAATLFNVFFNRWLCAVAIERLASPDIADASSRAVALLAADRLSGLAARLLAADPQGWFQRPRTSAIVEAFQSALNELSNRLGDNMDQWQWGNIHRLQQPHYLSNRGDLGSLLDLSGLPMPGDGTTVCSAAPNAELAAYLGAGFRSVVDLGDPGLGMWVIDAASASAHPGSANYSDQLEPWSRGEYRYVSLDTHRAAASAVCTLEIESTDANS